ASERLRPGVATRSCAAEGGLPVDRLPLFPGAHTVGLGLAVTEEHQKSDCPEVVARRFWARTREEY
ncbi:MAG TPA: hypothetical protein VEP50_18495, partial [bacterium]|nr:hypothetical protein [bacterium]